MKTKTVYLLNKYLNLGGTRTYSDFAKFFREVVEERMHATAGQEEYKYLIYLEEKAMKGIELCAQHGDIFVIIDEQSIEDIEETINKSLGKKPKASKTKARPAPKKRRTRQKKPAKTKGKDLGKIVDHGTTAPEGNSDKYWDDKGIELVFEPNDKRVRTGEKIPSTYKFADMRFLEKFYGLKAFEFGNWLSQQDRLNYLSGLGIALFDLYRLLGFEQKHIGLDGKLSVSFGARGRGTALAHFEPSAFVINLTRYSRPKELNKRTKDFKRVDLILQDGGVGAFAHEYGHALDFFAGTFIEKADEWQISGGRSVNHAVRYPSLKKPKLQGLMDNILNKILWKGKNVESDYSKRLNKKGTKEYFLRRNEIWARSFEVYVQFKLEKKKHKNVFLNKSKYPTRYYLTLSEMKKLEKDFDALLIEIKKHL